MQLENLEDIYELSPMQQGMLFHSIAFPQSNAYIQQFQCVIEGKLQLPTFLQAWREVIHRHPILRTAFYWEDLEKPVQVVYRHVDFSPNMLDWRALSAEEKEEKWNEILADDLALGFDFANSPLMRITLIQTEDEVHRLVWTHHHIILDGWSIPLLLRELFGFYQNKDRQEELNVRQVSPYKAYISWLDQQDVEKAENYWRQELRDLSSSSTRWLSSRGRDVLKVPAIAEQTILLPDSLTAKIRDYARSSRYTVSTIIQGAWALLLRRYSQDDDVLYGLTVSGRPPALSGVESMIGLFINTLPMRMKIDPTMKVHTYLEQVQKKFVEVQEFDYTPLSKIHEWSDNQKGEPLFASIFVFENYPVHSLESIINDIEIKDVSFREETDYPLTVTVSSTKLDRLSISISYQQELFSSEAMSDLLNHLEMLLLHLVSEPEQLIQELPSITEKELNRIKNWNQTEQDFPQDQTIDQILEQWAERDPARTAVVDRDRVITYGELNEKANKLAAYLLERGVSSNVPVAVVMDKSIELIVGIVGIMKAGGAYVPIDPAYPKERFHYLLTDCSAKFVVTTSNLMERIGDREAQIICLDDEWENLNAYPASLPKGQGNKAEDLAYMIYTSGSTGNPKGVMVQHQSLINIGYAWLKEYQLDTFAVSLLQIASTSFDVFAGDLVRTIISGGRMIICPEKSKLDLPALYQLIHENQVSIVESTPALLVPLFDYIHDTDLPVDSMKLLILGSDQLALRDYERLVERFGSHMRIVNSYGTTETTIDSSYFESSLDELANHYANTSQVPIGKPMPNTSYYILDEQLKPQPIGVPGELYIGGRGVAKGYHNRAELTQTKFVDDPFSSGSRMYRTGDMARWNEQGVVEFMGRNDHQIKIRGYRVEIGEIEKVMLTYPHIKSAAVHVHQNHTGIQMLCAYVTSSIPAFDRHFDELRAYLSGRLPDYMIPTHYMLLESLPLTHNAKIDYRALPFPIENQDLHVSEGQLEDDVERRLVSIWQEVLGVGHITRNQSFFDLGGNSMLILKLFNALKKEFTVEVTVADLFSQHTIQMLASFIRTKQEVDEQEDLETILKKLESGQIDVEVAKEKMKVLSK
ncbi:non-ribosomal peptide synthetase [Brevibacillus dissolubilis]|uniref:non-ribosomal peptide synthetase n=1 Tax=Brevibacillus dissolubilis TaxID=1844116 RepID=UPI001115ED5D|nr:non-ribosomal peptide synthetase [Brevibacillus dissolubilis]